MKDIIMELNASEKASRTNLPPVILQAMYDEENYAYECEDGVVVRLILEV